MQFSKSFDFEQPQVSHIGHGWTSSQADCGPIVYAPKSSDKAKLDASKPRWEPTRSSHSTLSKKEEGIFDFLFKPKKRGGDLFHPEQDKKSQDVQSMIVTGLVILFFVFLLVKLLHWDVEHLQQQAIARRRRIKNT